MQTVKEKIAYLRGMLDGSGDLFKDNQMGLVLNRIVDVLDDLADDVDELYIEQEQMDEYLEVLDADLADIEDHACGCAHHDKELDVEQELEMVEMECPSCQDLVYFEEDFLYDDNIEVTCPECGEVIYTSEELDEDLEVLDE